METDLDIKLGMDAWMDGQTDEWRDEGSVIKRKDYSSCSVT